MGGIFRKHLTTDNHIQQCVNLPDLQPYLGHPVAYYHVTIKAELDNQSHFSFMPPNVTLHATDEELYYPKLAAVQDQGYKMLTFAAFPGSIRNYGFATAGKSKMAIEFQGIFRKTSPDEVGPKWDLKVVKSTLNNQLFTEWNGVVCINADSPRDGDVIRNCHICQTLQTIAEEGGRLISVELTGMSEEQIEIQKQFVERQMKTPHKTAGTMPEMQVAVDVFFEIPRHSSSKKYVYQIVSRPLESTYQHTFPRSHFTTVVDWKSLMSQYLETGWKLVDILEDYSVNYLATITGFRPTCTQVKSCLWIFEKPQSRINDNTQYFEATAFEHWSSMNDHEHDEANMSEAADWVPVIEHYGKKGWQVVKILDTPDTKIEGAFKQTVFMKLLIFFQRRLHS